MSNMQNRTARTRNFFKLDSWNMDAADAWQHILTGACDDDDLYDNNSFNSLDMDNMFNEYRMFGIACNNAFHYLISNIDKTLRIAGFIYVDTTERCGEVEFINADSNHERAEWLFDCAQDGAGVLLRAFVDSVGAINIELVA